jgi:hypothetical protein
MEYTNKSNLTVLILTIDFEKAFDTVDWTFLHKTLRSFNFGDDFASWVKLKQQNATSAVINNGFTSSYFPLKGGVSQGDPLSHYLFTLMVELMAINIRENKYTNPFPAHTR